MKSILVTVVLVLSIVATDVVAAEKLLIQNGTLLTMQPGAEAPFIGYLAIDSNGKISAVGKGIPPKTLKAETTYDASGKLVIPGFVSAHSHIWQSAFRGLAANQYVRGWSEVIYRQMAIQTSPEDFYWFTLHGCVDHLTHGVTSIYNFTYGSRGPIDFAKQQWRGEVDCGARFIHAYARPRDTPNEHQRAELAQFMSYIKPDISRPQVLKVSLAGTSQPLEAVKLDVALMKEFGLSNETHYLEWPLQKEQQQANFTNLVEAGILGPDLSFGHFIHTTDPMLKAVAAAGAGMSWNPLSNGRLASGIADIPKYLSLGVKVGMGVDGQASADLPDPFENMRVGLYMVRAKYESALVLQPMDMLRMHTLGGAQVLGIADKVGSLEVGKLGDVLVIDPRAMDRAPVFDPAATLVFACNGLNLEKVFVGGELVVDAHHPVRQDFNRISAELTKRVTRLNPPRIAARPEAVRPLSVGARVPGAVTVQTEQGKDTTLAQALAGRPAFLIFHRGGWCPYCDMQLAELRLIEPELRSLGYQIVAITPDTPQALRRRSVKDALGYTLLSDQSTQLTEAFGIAFKVDVAKLGAAASQVRPVLPVPSVFIVDGEGVVRFQYVTPDYRVLVPKDLLLAAARSSLPAPN